MKLFAETYLAALLRSDDPFHRAIGEMMMKEEKHMDYRRQPFAQLKPDRPDLKAAKEYIGDGVYAGLSPYGDVDLWTTDGVSVTNRIVLEPSVLHALVDWIRRHTTIE